MTAGPVCRACGTELLEDARFCRGCSSPIAMADTHAGGVSFGVLKPDDSAVAEIEDVLSVAERSGDDVESAFARMTLGIALVNRPTDAERDRGHKLLTEVSQPLLRLGYLSDLPLVDLYLARERARGGACDAAIPVMRTAVDRLFLDGQLPAWVSAPATGVLVETLLDRGTQSDVAEAEAAIERLAGAPADDRLAMRDIWLLRLRALLARARGEGVNYLEFVNRYRDMATLLGFDGHIAWAEAMP
jgi:hypothetical protein